MKKLILSFVSVAFIATSLPANAGGIKCSDFRNHSEAQAYFNAKKPGYKRLDRDKDGVACEALQ